MDLGLLRTPISSRSMAATVVDDLVNWTLFAIILSDIAPSSATTVGGSLGVSIALVVISSCRSSASVAGSGRGPCTG